MNGRRSCGARLRWLAAKWIPEERATLPDLLAAYTVNGAYANHVEKTTGSLETGKAADLIILDRNLFPTPVHEIGKTRVLRTFLDGKEVHRADASAAVSVHRRRRERAPASPLSPRS